MKKFFEKIRQFFDSNLYIALVFAFTVAAWYYRIQIVAMSIYVVILAIIILTDAKRINIITLIMATVINYRVAKMEENLSVMIVFAVILLPIVIFDFIRKKPKVNNPIFISMVVFLAINILSLVNTSKDTIILGLVGVGQILLYTVIFLYFFTNRQKDDHKKIAVNAMAMGLAIAGEMTLLLWGLKDQSINKSLITLGWGLSNFIAITVAVLLFLTIYLYVVNQKNKLALLTVALELVVIAITLSKGAFLALGILVIPLAVFVVMSVENKKMLIFDGVLMVLVLALIVFAAMQVDSLKEAITHYLTNMDERGWLNDPSRIKIYKIGFDLFKKHPLLGAGSYTSQYYLEHNINYHNYIIQTMATLGVAGLIGFGYFIYCIVRASWTKDPFNMLVLFILVEMSIHGLVDTTWYNPLIMVILAFVLANLKDKVNKTDLELL